MPADEQVAEPAEIVCDHCGGIPDECTCVFCPRCHDECHEEQCTECDRCPGCCTRCSDCQFHDCECRSCENCDARGPDLETCGECNCCNDCCTCASEETPPSRAYESPLRLREKGQRLVGVEIEYNSVSRATPLADFCRAWGAGDHEDGSCGREIVTAPMSGTHIDSCLRALDSAFDNATTQANEKCGIHVHVDAADLQWSDMFRLLHVYARVEPLLYVLAGQQRVANSFCRPTGERYLEALGTADRKGEVLGVAWNSGTPEAARQMARRKPGKKDRGRYKGLNICPWLAGRQENARGKTWCMHPYDMWGKKRRARPKKPSSDTTVEFRLHRNTLDMDRVAQWAHLCERLVSWVAKASDREAQSLPRSALRALCQIAPESRGWILSRILAWRHSTGVRRNGFRKFPRRVGLRRGRWTITDRSED